MQSDWIRSFLREEGNRLEMSTLLYCDLFYSLLLKGCFQRMMQAYLLPMIAVIKIQLLFDFSWDK